MAVDILQFEEELKKALTEISDEVFEANEDALDEAEKVLIEELKSKTPVKTGGLKRGWKSTKRKYKGQRYVHNTKQVNKIPLINIIEYSEKRGKPFVKKTFNDAVPKMVSAYINKLKEKL